MALIKKVYPSPLGKIYLTASDQGLVSLRFSEQEKASLDSGQKTPASKILNKVTQQLDLYFEGKLKRFDVSLDLKGTEFQMRVWKALLKIPYGKTCSYSELAKKIGNENASRAVGTANGKNPISIIIPCHRVIAADGSLGGYSGGTQNKIRLLTFESY